MRYVHSGSTRKVFKTLGRSAQEKKKCVRKRVGVRAEREREREKEREREREREGESVKHERLSHKLRERRKNENPSLSYHLHAGKACAHTHSLPLSPFSRSLILARVEKTEAGKIIILQQNVLNFT